MMTPQQKIDRLKKAGYQVQERVIKSVPLKVL